MVAAQQLCQSGLSPRQAGAQTRDRGHGASAGGAGHQKVATTRQQKGSTLIRFCFCCFALFLLCLLLHANETVNIMQLRNANPEFSPLFETHRNVQGRIRNILVFYRVLFPPG